MTMCHGEMTLLLYNNTVHSLCKDDENSLLLYNNFKMEFSEELIRVLKLKIYFLLIVSKELTLHIANIPLALQYLLRPSSFRKELLKATLRQLRLTRL
jgi:hypothetical protein